MQVGSTVMTEVHDTQGKQAKRSLYIEKRINVYHLSFLYSD